MSGTVTPLNGLRPDIPLQVGQGVAQPQNPLATFGQFANIQNALTQNRALEAGITQTETGTRGMEQSQKIQRIGIMGQIVGGMLLENPNGVPAAAVADGAAHLLSMGVLKRDEIGPLLSALPMGDDPASTAARTSALRQFQVQSLGIGEQVGRVRGVPTVQNTGGELVPGMLGEGGWRPTPGAIPNTMPPTSAADLVDVPVMGPDGKPTGRMEKITRAEAARRGGLPGTVAPSVFGDGRLPPALRNPNAPAAAPTTPPAVAAPPPAPAAPAVPAPPVAPATPAPRATGSFGVTPSPAEVAAATSGGAKSADAFARIAEVASGAPDRRAGLQNMLAEADKFATGPGQENIKLMQQVLQRFAPNVAAALGVTEASLAANEAFDKIAARIASQQGAGSDARLGVAQAANPSSKLSPAGVRLIITQLIGNEDYIAARAKLAQAYPDKTDTAGFEANVGANLDPRVFQYNRMTGDQKREFYSTIRDKGAFKRAFDWAASQGLLAN